MRHHSALKSKGHVLNSVHQLEPWKSSSSVSWPKVAWSVSQSAAPFWPSRTCEHSFCPNMIWMNKNLQTKTKQKHAADFVLPPRCRQKALHRVRGTLWLLARSGRAGHHCGRAFRQQRDERVADVQVETVSSINQSINKFIDRRWSVYSVKSEPKTHVDKCWLRPPRADKVRRQPGKNSSVVGRNPNRSGHQRALICFDRWYEEMERIEVASCMELFLFSHNTDIFFYRYFFFFSFSQIQDAGEFHQKEGRRGGSGAATVQRLVVKCEFQSNTFHKKMRLPPVALYCYCSQEMYRSYTK